MQKTLCSSTHDLSRISKRAATPRCFRPVHIRLQPQRPAKPTMWVSFVTPSHDAIFPPRPSLQTPANALPCQSSSHHFTAPSDPAFQRLISYISPPNTSLPSPATSPFTLARVLSSNSLITFATKIFLTALSAFAKASPTAALH